MQERLSLEAKRLVQAAEVMPSHLVAIQCPVLTVCILLYQQRDDNALELLEKRTEEHNRTPSLLNPFAIAKRLYQAVKARKLSMDIAVIFPFQRF